MIGGVGCGHASPDRIGKTTKTVESPIRSGSFFETEHDTTRRREGRMKPPQDTGEPSAASAGSVSIGEAHNIGYDEWYCQWYLCPECMKSSINRSFSYCPDCGVQLKWQDSPQNHAMLNEGDEMSASAAGSRGRDVCDWLGCAMLGEKFDLRLLQSAKTEIERLRLTAEEREAIREAVGAYNDNDDDEECAKIAATLWRLLERTSAT